MKVNFQYTYWVDLIGCCSHQAKLHLWHQLAKCYISLYKASCLCCSCFPYADLYYSMCGLSGFVHTYTHTPIHTYNHTYWGARTHAQYSPAPPTPSTQGRGFFCFVFNKKNLIQFNSLVCTFQWSFTLANVQWSFTQGRGSSLRRIQSGKYYVDPMGSHTCTCSWGPQFPFHSWISFGTPLMERCFYCAEKLWGSCTCLWHSDWRLALWIVSRNSVFVFSNRRGTPNV